MSTASETSDGAKCVDFSEVIKIDEGKVRRHVEGGGAAIDRGPCKKSCVSLERQVIEPRLDDVACGQLDRQKQANHRLEPGWRNPPADPLNQIRDGGEAWAATRCSLPENQAFLGKKPGAGFRPMGLPSGFAVGIALARRELGIARKRMERLAVGSPDAPAVLSSEGKRAGYSDNSAASTETSQSIDWYAEGGQRIVDAGGVQITVRFVGRKGRRGRIAITAPPGAAFRTCNRKKTGRPPDWCI